MVQVVPVVAELLFLHHPCLQGSLSYLAPEFQMADMEAPEVPAVVADSQDHSSQVHKMVLVVVQDHCQSHSIQEHRLVLEVVLVDLAVAAEAAAQNQTLYDHPVQMMMVATNHPREVDYHYRQDLDHLHLEVVEAVQSRHSVARNSADHHSLIRRPIQSLICHPS